MKLTEAATFGLKIRQMFREALSKAVATSEAVQVFCRVEYETRYYQ